MTILQLLTENARWIFHYFCFTDFVDISRSGYLLNKGYLFVGTWYQARVAFFQSSNVSHVDSKDDKVALHNCEVWEIFHSGWRQGWKWCLRYQGRRRRRISRALATSSEDRCFSATASYHTIQQSIPGNLAIPLGDRYRLENIWDLSYSHKIRKVSSHEGHTADIKRCRFRPFVFHLPYTMTTFVAKPKWQTAREGTFDALAWKKVP